MRQTNKNKKGFTLVEVMLALAIMMITVGAFYGLIISVQQAHVDVYNYNDAADYASLNAQAIENVVLSSDYIGSNGGAAVRTLSSDGNILCVNNSPAFAMATSQITKNGVLMDRYRLVVYFTVVDSETVDYTVEVYNNFDDHLDASVSGSVWLPHSNDDGATLTYSAERSTTLTVSSK
ncbi:MAG TPA: prepilin-type N-terminal cleavage/methylation domain-containing protein [Saccharofermentans sp.]|nr:prepilin-type N-terminal cleavage/methylation domain-containing protein [Saccharofermentans sp.]HRV50937.1 prepilin-type N-terminal cleavage/methylation domain-containing protein [Saccharofermentans sp.]